MKKNKIELDEFLKELKMLVKSTKELKKKKSKTKHLFDMFHPSHEISHSVVLAYLLNPAEQDEQETKYLELFIKSCGLPIKKEELTQVEVYAEYPVKLGKQINIFIKINTDTCIIIENKIDERDQNDQLIDCHKFAKNIYKNVYVLYLTLDGNEHSDKKREFKEIQKVGKYFNISYREHILNWLDSLTFTSAEQDLRSSVDQYLDTLYVLVLHEF